MDYVNNFMIEYVFSRLAELQCFGLNAQDEIYL